MSLNLLNFSSCLWTSINFMLNFLFFFNEPRYSAEFNLHCAKYTQYRQAKKHDRLRYTDCIKKVSLPITVMTVCQSWPRLVRPDIKTLISFGRKVALDWDIRIKLMRAIAEVHNSIFSSKSLCQALDLFSILSCKASSSFCFRTRNKCMQMDSKFILRGFWWSSSSVNIQVV